MIELEQLAPFVQAAQDDFYTYLRLPTISAQHTAIDETVAWVKKMLEDRHGEVQVLSDLGGHPVIAASFLAKENPEQKATLLFYNHYDVQPPEPFEEWLSAPFEPTVRDGILYCRGVSDNKGNLMSRLIALDALMALEGGLPCNVKFLIEGEEEIGSPHLEAVLEKYAHLFKADGCIWEFGGKQEDESFVIDCGLKGLIYMELTAQTADIDAHSSLAAIVDNAAWRLVQALSTLKSADNRILIDGFYDEVIKPSARDIELALASEVSEAAYRKNLGMRRPFISDGLGEEAPLALAFDPTLTINGLLSGYTGEGAKTVLPKKAMAKLECRLVLDQTPEHIAAMIRKHLDKYGFTDIDLRVINGQRAYRSNIEDPFIQLVVASAEVVYDEVKTRPTNAGTGPMDLFGKYLPGLPAATSGAGWARSQAHAPNESMRLQDFDEAIYHMVVLMDMMATMKEKENE